MTVVLAPRRGRISGAINILAMFSREGAERAQQMLPYADLALMTVGAVSDNPTPLLLALP